MHRSSSATMFRTTTDEYFLSLLPPVKPSKPPSEDLPVYNPISPDGTKKEHYKSPSENAIHLIPVVLILCGFILWFFSHPIGEAKESFYMTKRTSCGVYLLDFACYKPPDSQKCTKKFMLDKAKDIGYFSEEAVHFMRKVLGNAGLMAIGLAEQLLQVHHDTYALVMSTERNNEN
ncbi:hypothetical protein L2E82_03151 [Cichorium intybus]|uniref:Uncharacterized protein n=1 Tax=Cichorium intybus TaxID=13427 RepID=A0ACB9H502_CICIN|nr:hypothetical protein L2E82_03151 [Cichorium intybus]